MRVALFERLEERCLLSAAPPSTIGLFNPAASEFQLRFSNNRGNANAKFAFGGSNLLPLAGDFDGDRLDTIGVYDPAQSLFQLRNENSAGAPNVSFVFGQPGTSAQPIVGDWDGDGIDTVGLYRADTGQFFLRNENSAGPAQFTFAFGPAGGSLKPIAGDWDGDGIDAVGLYDPASRTFRLAQANAAGTGAAVFAFRGGGTLPVIGDWNGDGIDTIGVYDRAKSSYSLRNSNSSGKANLSFSFGKPGQGLPIAGNWSHGRAFPAAGIYTVPGQPGQIVPTTFTWVSRSAGSDNEVGLFAVDDHSGRIGSLRPNDRGYAAAALRSASRVVVFKSGEGAGATKTVDLSAGSYFALYMIEDNTTEAFLRLNPSNSITKQPRAYFSIPRASSDKFEHFRPMVPNLFAWEDQKGGGDRDFNDVVGKITYSTPVVPPTSDQTPPEVTLTSPSANLLTNQAVVVAGRVTDDRSGVASVQARLDSSSFFDVQVGNDGSFQFTPALPLDGSQDGQHSITVRATDGAGNVSLDATRSVTIDTTRPSLSLDLSRASDTAPLGDRRTTLAVVDLEGQTEPTRPVELLRNGQVIATATADGSGRFLFSSVNLAAGANAYTARTSDAAGNFTELAVSFVLEGCTFDPGLTGWTAGQSGGSAAGQGSVSAQNCSALMVEGDSFLVTLARSITIPATPSVLKFSFSNLAFDTADPDFVKDAFEVAIVDAQGISLVPTFVSGRDAFFNVTEGLTAAVGNGVLISGNQVTVNLAGLTPGAAATLIFRLANDDSDTHSQVQLDDFLLRPATAAELQQFAASGENGAAQPAALAAALAGESASAIDFSRFSDITASFSDLYFRTSFDDGRETLFVDLATRNDGIFQSSVPLLVSVTNVSDPSVRVRDADGFTPGGAPFFDLSRQLADKELSPGETSSTRSLAFYNPGHVPFTFDLSFHGLLNQSPAFTSEPDEEALVGQPYFYQPEATDPNGDPLTFSLVAAPAGMAIEPSTGRITFTPTAADVGTHAVNIEVSDGRGGSGVQTFVLTVDQDVPNRPPVLVSTPIVDANVNTPYRYAPEILEADGDSLTFALGAAPEGMAINPATGAITWTPTANQLGANAVEVTVSDGRGGNALQSYKINVAAEIGNHAPIIISEPVTSKTVVENVVSVTVPGTSDPWLAGMPDGSTASGGDVAPLQSPRLAQGLTLVSGKVLTFTVTGSVANVPGPTSTGPDGATGSAISHTNAAQNGIADILGAPINSLVGVFLGAEVPSSTPAPSPLNFGSGVAGGINYLSLAPALKQPFFIGDGKTAAGVTQQVVVPAGAMRLMLGTMDGVEWSNNVGSFQVTVSGSLNLLGPLPYLGRADSPFDLSGLGTTFFLEDFEDHLLNTPGLSVNSGIPASTFAGGALNDSVDGDDGVIDGSGARGDDWFSGPIRFAFDPNVLGGFPTEAGLVWTDGAHGGTDITFEAFDAQGNSLGKLVGNHGDPFANGETAEDRFYGVSNVGGISAISVINASGGLEVDHVQYGFGADSLYQYQVRALDPDDDSLTYALTTAPPGATIDGQGLIKFVASPGEYPFVVRVSDGRGGFDTQSFNVTVSKNRPPVITSTPVTEFTIPPGDSSPPSGDVQPTAINLRLANGQTQTVAVQLSLPSAGSLVPNADVFLLFDDTGSFAPTAPAVISQFQSIIDQLQAALPNVHFGFGVGRFEDYANLATGPQDRPFLLNQPIITTDQAGFLDAITGALARQASGSGGDTPESLIEALFQTATGLGFDGNNDGDTSDTGSAGTIAAQLVANASGDVPAFTSIDDPVGFSFRMLDVANLPTLPLDTTITRTMNPGSLNDVFQFQGTASERLFFDSQFVTFPPPAFTARIFAVEHPRWSLFDSQNRLVARDDLANDRELTLPATDTYVLFVENNDVEGPLDYSFRLTTPETIAVPYTLGTFVSAAISEPRERDQYTFTLTAPTRLDFDAIEDSFGNIPFAWSLEGPSGPLLDEVRRGISPGRQFDPGALNILPESTIQLLPAGDYRLTISGVPVDTTGTYQFRLSDLADATPITTDSVIHPTFDHFSETKLFRFGGQAGQHISWEDLGPSDVVAYLIDPFRQVVFRADGFADTTLAVTGTYTLAVETFSAPGSGSFIVKSLPPPAAPIAIGVGDVVTGSIDSRTETDSYSFSLASPIHAYFDNLDSRGGGLLIRLTNSQNDAYIDTTLDGTDGRSQNKPFLFLPAGDYHVIISHNDAGTGPYAFQIKDITGAESLSYGVPKDGTKSPGIETDLFTLSGAQGDQVTFNVQSPSFDSFRLLSPIGDILFATTSNHPQTVTLPRTGTYRVLVEGNGLTDEPYTLTADLVGNVPITPPPSAPLTIGDTVNADISASGEVDRYTFTLNAPRTLSFDALSFSDLQWSLTGPDGAEVPTRAFFFSDDSLSPIRLGTGSYELKMTGGSVTSYSFRLLDLAAATPVAVAAIATGEISPPTETDMFQFQVTNPGRFFFDNQTASVPGGAEAQLVLVDPQGFRVLSTGFLSGGSPLDTEAVLTSPGAYTILLEGNIFSHSTQSYQFKVTALPDTPPTVINFGQLVDTSISQPGEQDTYTFTLPQDGAIYMDAMTLNGNLRYTLTGPMGTIVNAQDFTVLESAFSFAKVKVNPFPAPAGQYTITVDALGDTTPSYRFRVLNPRDAATPISLDTPIRGTLDPGSTSQFFRLDISQPGAYYFDNRTPPPPSGGHIWRLYDPLGNVVFSQDFIGTDGSGADADVKLPFAGSYSLLLEGSISNQAPVPFEFFIRPTTANTIPLTLNQTITGNLANAGDTDRYAFSLARETLVYVDALTNDAQFTWSLEGPQGPVRLAAFIEETFARNFTTSEGSDRNPDSFEAFRLPAGDYVLTIDGISDHTGPYQFRLDDAAAAIPITPGTPFSGELSPPSETDLYRFEATAGDVMIVHSQAQSIATGAIFNLIDPYGQIVTSPNPFDRFVPGEDFEFTVPRTGTYTLLVEGRILDTSLVPHNFNVERVAATTLSAPVADTLSLDSLQSGQLEDLRSFKTLTFAGQAGQRLFFDGIQPGGSTVFRLVAPSGEQLFGLVSRPINIRRNGTLTSPVANGGPFTLPETGTYQLIIDDTEDSVGRRAPDALLGGAGFRPGALPIILAATDTGTAFQPDGIDPIVGAGGVSIPLSQFLSSSRPSTPQGRGATIQGTISALNSLGALVIGMGTNADADSAPRRTLEAISRVTGAVNASADTFDNNTSDPIGPGDPFYYQIQEGNGARTAQGITAAILQSLHNVSFDVDVVPSDPSVVIENLSGIRAALGAGDAANFNIRFTGDSLPHSFDLLFAKAGTGVILGSIPVRINANPYAYDVEATDPDGDTVAFSLTDPPDGASIDPQTGVISFVPAGPGLFPFTVEATDEHGGVGTQQFFVTVNDGQPNQLPSITSSAITTTLVNGPYSYAVAATDPDGDSLSFFLTKAPDGMTIDQSTGEIAWTPAAKQLGASDVTVRVLDSHGGAATQSFQVTVTTNSVEAPPRIVSTPPTAAEVGRLLRYDVSAIDPNLDPLQFDLPVKSPGMVIDPAGGTFVWRPTLDQVGTHDVILRVRDGRGGVELQAFQITVTLANTAPVITSRPTGNATADLPFVYQVRAQDAEDDTLTYTLRSALPGMAIDPSTGLFAWTPTVSQLGSALVTIVVTDPHGAEATQDVLITVDSASTNQPPVINSSPRLRTGLQTLYLYQVQAADPNGDPLVYALTTAPQGMSIDAAGLISWQPSPGQLGTGAVELAVSDGRGGIATQSYSIEVVSQPVNSTPIITSTAPEAATVGRAFAYDAVAVDADNDPLVWSLDEGPIGVSIDEEFGSVRWTPAADQRGEQTIVLRVTDPLGGSATQTMTVIVRSTNVPPVFATSPPTQAAVNLPYRYAPRVFDRNGDIPAFRLTAAPLGMTIDGATGVIDWTPTANQLGTHDVALVVDDGQGGSTRQLFRIAVTQTLNRPPAITSTPPTAAAVDFTYQYDANATDPDGDALFFDVLNPPSGMIIDGVTGLLTWVPQVGQAGQHTVTVQVTDARGAVASQTFAIDVALDNQFPILSGPPLAAAAAGQLYRFDVPASDPDGDPLSYHLDVGPAGMTIDSLGRVLWQTTPADVGNHPVQITIGDNRGAEIELDYTITVAVDSQAPRVTLAVSENPVDIGNPVAFLIRATDDIAVTSLVLTVGGTPLPLDRNGRATFLASQAGLFEAVATATDASGNVATSRGLLQVRDPSDVNAPTVEITSPEDDAVVTTFTDIVGTVNDDNLLFYTLSVAPADGGSFTEIARGTMPVVNGLLGRFDPTLLENDSYILRLAAVDAGGNVSTIERTINSTGNLKLGNFRVSFTDLAIPVTGVPITVVRTYDSLAAAHDSEMGFGWTLEIRNTDLRTSVPKTGDETDGIFNPFRDRSRVTIRLPDGSRQGFTFQPRLRFSLFGLKLFHPEFVPDPGVSSKLIVGQFDLQRSRTGDYFGMTAGGLPYNPADAAFGGNYTLTTREGEVFTIDGLKGDLERVVDRNGNTLIYTDDGVFSTSGVSISFQRDSKGRVVAVTDPAGHSIRYGYDANGDLASITDREGNITQFKYNTAARPHFLDEIIDPLGRSGARMEYDDEGRLVRASDVGGDTRSVQFDIDNNTETVLDELGNPTTYVYDNRGNIVVEVDAGGGITRSTYDANDNLLSQSDPLGNTRSYTYDANEFLLSQADPLGNVSRYTRGPHGSLASRTSPLGSSYQFELDARGNLTREIDPLGNATLYQRADSGRILAMTDTTGNVTRYSYDAAGNRLAEIDALGNQIQYSYDRLGNQLTKSMVVTRPDGPRLLTTINTYDAEGRKLTVTDPEGNITHVEYDALGNPQTASDALGRRTEAQFEDERQPVSITFADGRVASRRFDAARNTIAATDRNGDTAHFFYDALSQPTALVRPDATPSDLDDNPTLRFEYDASHRLSALTDELGHRTELEYDGAGRQTVIRDALGNVTRMEFDADGRRISATDELGRTTHYEYDDMGRLLEESLPDGTSHSFSYDALGNTTAITDAARRTTHYEYDALNRLATVVDALGVRTEYAYDEAGNIVEQRDGNNHVTRFEYDGNGRQTAVIRPLGQRSEVTYDAVGNIIRRRDFNGHVIEYEYDTNNRLLVKRFSDGSQVTFTYTSEAQRETATDDRGTTRYEYDALGRLTARTDPDGAFVLYSYNPAGRVSTITSLTGTTTYTYDDLNRLQTIEDSSGITSYEYDAAGNLLRTRFPNGTLEERTYDLLNRVSQVETRAGDGTPLVRFRYTRDAVGNIVAVEELDGRRVEYVYDQTYRLVRERILEPSSPERTIDYVYDAVGNRLSRQDSLEGLTQHNYDANDRLLTEIAAGQTTSYAYDNNGNLVSKATDAVDRVFYEWDDENWLRAVEVTDGNGTDRTEYDYDADGLRVAARSNGQEIRYLLDNNRRFAQVLSEYSPTGATQATYTYGADRISQTRGGAASFYTYDVHSGVRGLTDAAGSLTDRYTYDSFGELLARTGSTRNDFLYRGEQFDQSVGLEYLRARHYDASTGRFVSADSFAGSFQQPGSLHDYLYASANPVMNRDPSGHNSLIEISVVNAMILTLSVAVTAVEQAIASFARGISGETTWEGRNISVVGGEVNVAGGILVGDLKSECVATRQGYGRQTNEYYLLLGAGFGVDAPLDKPFKALEKALDGTTEFLFARAFAGAFGEFLDIVPGLGTGSVNGSSPAIFGVTKPVFAGAFWEAIDASLVVGVGVGATVIWSGLGEFHSFGGGNYGLDVGIETLGGLSIPLGMGVFEPHEEDQQCV